MSLEPVTLVEVDLDRCTRTFGAAPCTAALSAEVPRKCFNTFGTCSAKAAFLSAPVPMTFAENRPGLPASDLTFPFLESVSQITATVNIAGSDENMGGLGRRATVAVVLRDHPHNDQGLDLYRAGRVSGSAQWGGAGYDPAARGTFFGKLKARWPHYSGRAMRIREGYLEAGAFVLEQTRHYILTDWTGPDDDGRVTLTGKDPLSVLDDDQAVIPPASKGALGADITAAAVTLTLLPAGIGAGYPSAGRACIGSEIVEYTRAGDVVTMTGRGMAGTAAAAHKAGDTFQEVLWINDQRIDAVAATLITARLPVALVPAAAWAVEADRWASSVRLSTHICAPTGIAKLVGELTSLGVSIFWDDVAQAVAFKVNRPVDGDAVYDLSDFGNIMEASLEDRNGDRLTEVYFFTVQLDPTKSASSADNFARVLASPDLEAMDPRAFGDSRIRKVFCRWVNGGADPVITFIAKRLLNRFRLAPARLKITVDAKDRTIPLAAVVRVDCDLIQDVTGDAAPALMQVISRAPSGPGGRVEYVLQAYQFTARYGFATQNARPSYLASTAAERARGFYACDPATLKMSNNDEPYRAI
jgi:hypothetical protein